MRGRDIILVALCAVALTVLASCGLWEIITSAEGKERAAEAAGGALSDPTAGGAVKSIGDYLVWLLAAWVGGDRVATVRRRKRSNALKADLAERVAKLENGGSS